eukprot:CAMPEP_0113497686 /NCGR_PEP_ID=MMETSP0014_2-20120614/30760_1 /TAXON_ID=2857 /ORGANISM="Nitzschia sp." /LENGTH=335 /DNA_ID=CAMNT_0000391637 /DNA_START=183 /DNA_END=1190 /DNA_ORIENTATION=- /assembly_acc=CAM_ASM_000159
MNSPQGGGINKLMIMVPVMLAARKLDAEDPNVVYWLRVAYGSVQTLCVLVVAYTYLQASAVASKKMEQLIYVPAPASPFADPNAKKKYTEVQYGAHVLSTARSLLQSTLFGVCMTVGLHLYKGMAMGLAIQTIMGPFNLFENPMVKALLLGNGFLPEDKIFDEKTVADLTADDEIVDEEGNIVVRRVGDGKSSARPEPTFEEVLLDTWDAGTKADLTKLMEAMNKKNCNYKTKENGWTPLMILSGLNAKGTASAIKQVMSLGGNPAIVDADGWNALHWAAFHNSIDAAKELVSSTSSLATVKDKDGKLPVELAKAEKNDDVAKFLEGEMESKKSK